ncbi:MAG: hypothetical protein ACJA08_000436 [Cyclobacteriaceae bacterium]
MIELALLRSIKNFYPTIYGSIKQMSASQKIKSSLLILCLLLLSKLNGQLYINEFLASNATTNADPDYAEYSDWFELYNAGATAVNLKGYYLTDNLGKPDKWKIADDLTIAAGGYLLFWADDIDIGIHTSFKLALEGEELGLFDANLNEVDALIYPYQKSDVSMGRNRSSLQEWLYFDTPTPGTANASTGYTDFVKHKPRFGTIGGIFNETQNVTISTDMGGIIKYTSDGSEPNLNSPVFLNPIVIPVTTVLRASVFINNEIPGPIVTHTYFINENFELGKLPVVSIVSEPDNFWGVENGIYAQNFKPDWEVPINIELFENNGSDRAGFNEPAGAKINGLNSWVLPQKMLGIYFRGRYGSGNLDYPLFFDKDRRSFDSFALRASGSDWSYTLFRDILGQSITKGNMDVDIQGERPCVVYINGAYMGIHNFRSKIDGDFISKNHGLELGTFDMIENESLAEEGTLDEYQFFENLLAKDLSTQANYDAVAAVMDVENFTDYIITELYVRNTSIGHNVMAWKPHNSGKWKWILMDLDRGFFSPDANMIGYFEGQGVLPFGQLMKNAGYQDYFGDRLANHMITTFHPERVKSVIDFHKAAIEPEISNHIERWFGTTSSYGNAMPSVSYWESQVEALKNFANQRPSYLLNDLQNYGFGGLVNLTLISNMDKAGEITFNGLPIPTSLLNSPFIKNIEIQLEAKPKAGFKFLGWKELSKSTIIPKGSNWYYLDDGSNQGTSWSASDFDDSSWNSGQAQLGYGDGDETTLINYGSNSSAKYITTYLRHNFNLTTDQMNAIGFTLKLQYDDGAVVYVNGTEVARANMPAGNIGYDTNALSAVSGDSESAFNSFSIDNSSFVAEANTIAVEIHQNNGSSSDISFDLELDISLLGGTTYISNAATLMKTLSDDYGLVAVYETTDDCIVPNQIATNTILSTDCSPYYVTEDVVIQSGAILTINPGVEIILAANTSIYIYGQMNALGSPSSQILFKGLDNGNKAWGALIFQNTDSKSTLNYVSIINASHGSNTAMFPAALSAFNADLELNHLTIDNVESNPIAARYASVNLTNSTLHSKVTGDLINVKYGQANIRNCTFNGNNQPDTDAIDLDDVTDGSVRNCRIYNMLGFNSDAIDIGEGATNITIDSLVVYNIADKGISVGQRSTIKVTNSLFLNCNMGMGLKDSCRVTIDRCTFYGNNYAVSCFEKNIGDAGGNVKITNSILSNSGEASYLIDLKSTFSAKYSLSDNDALSANSSNIFGNPLFENPTIFDFRLKSQSLGIGNGLNSGVPTDLGAGFHDLNMTPPIMIAEIFSNLESLNLPEYIMLVNPATTAQNVSGYYLSKGVTGILPDGVIIPPFDTLYFSDNVSSTFWDEISKAVYPWQEGKLSNNGEAIELRESHGIIVDYVVFDENTWPKMSGANNFSWQLSDLNVDNHFSEYWLAVAMQDAPPLGINPVDDFTIYPNPTANQVFIRNSTGDQQKVLVYSIGGALIKTQNLDQDGTGVIEISDLSKGIYLFKIGNSVHRIVKIDN